MVDYCFLSGLVFLFGLNTSVHFAHGYELDKLVPNLKDIRVVYSDTNHRFQSIVSKIINQTKTEGVELAGNVTHVVDGDTIDINGIRIRLSLVDTPERGQPGFKEAKDYVTTVCLGKKGELDVDDGQRRGDQYGREVGVVYCDGLNINEKLMDNHLAKIRPEFCDVSEFSQENWAKASCNLK